MLPIQKKYVRYNFSTRKYKPEYICIHDTGNPGAGALNHYNYFNGGNRGASADFFVDSTNIIQIINTDIYYSWAVGDGRGKYGISNSNSCSIELCLEKDGRPSEATINNAIELTKYLMNYYNISSNKVVRHYDASRKSCPNSLMANNWNEWNSFKAKLSGQQVSTPTPSPTPQPNVNVIFEKAKTYNTPRCSELQNKLNKCGYSCGSVDGIYGEKTHNALGNFQMDNGLVKDFLSGTQTFAKLDEIISKQNPNTPTINFNQKVKEIQEVCNKYGSNLIVDGLYGAKTEAAIKNLPLAGLPYKTPTLTKWIQKVINCTQDGIFGANTDRKVREYQSKNNLKIDGLVGFSTIKSILGV